MVGGLGARHMVLSHLPTLPVHQYPEPGEEMREIRADGGYGEGRVQCIWPASHDPNGERDLSDNPRARGCAILRRDGEDYEAEGTKRGASCRLQRWIHERIEGPTSRETRR